MVWRSWSSTMPTMTAMTTITVPSLAAVPATCLSPVAVTVCLSHPKQPQSVRSMR
jgi:hypothetical protein